jgi:hypothetical protein
MEVCGDSATQYGESRKYIKLGFGKSGREFINIQYFILTK